MKNEGICQLYQYLMVMSARIQEDELASILKSGQLSKNDFRELLYEFSK